MTEPILKAISIADILLQKASVSIDGIGWEIAVSDKQKNIVRRHDYSLGRGSGGIILFYLELYSATGDKKFLKIVDKALRRVSRILKDDPANNYCFMTGRAGLAFVFLRAFKITVNHKYFLESVKLLEGCDEFLELSHVNNSFFEGRSGIVSILLDILPLVKHKKKIAKSIFIGLDRIVWDIRCNGTQASWHRNYAQLNDECGLAYGCAGIGLVLAKAASVLGIKSYLEISEMAFNYIGRRWQTESCNWPNFHFNVDTPQEDKNLVSIIKRDGCNARILDGADTLDYMNGSIGIKYAKLLVSINFQGKKLRSRPLKKIFEKINRKPQKLSVSDLSVLHVLHESFKRQCGNNIRADMLSEIRCLIEDPISKLKPASLNITDGLCALGYHYLVLSGKIDSYYFNPLNNLNHSSLGAKDVFNSFDLPVSINPNRYKESILVKHFQRTMGYADNKFKQEFSKPLLNIHHECVLKTFIKSVQKSIKSQNFRPELKIIFRYELTKYRMFIQERQSAYYFANRYISFLTNRKLQRLSDDEILAKKYSLCENFKIVSTRLNIHSLSSIDEMNNFILLELNESKEFVAESVLSNFDEILINFRRPVTGKAILKTILNLPNMEKQKPSIQLRVVELILTYVQSGVLRLC